MSNVYDYLSNHSRYILNSMLCIPRTHSQAVMAYLNDMDPTVLETAIQQLRTTTMITASTNIEGSSIETTYELSELARDYLSKHHPVPLEEEKILKKKLRQLIAAVERRGTEAEGSQYSFYTIKVRSPRDWIVARFLRDALTNAKSRNFKGAEESIAKAHQLAPNYFEVYRVEANVKAQQGNHSAARNAYESAIEFNPQSAPLRYWYAGFLMRYEDEMEEALKEFKEAAVLDPTSFEIQIEIVRTNLYLRRYEETRASLDELLRQTNRMKDLVRRKVYDLNLQFYIRKADYLILRHDSVGALYELENLQHAYQRCPQELIDRKMMEKLEKVDSLIRKCSTTIQDNPKNRERADKLLKWFDEVIEPSNIKATKNELKDRLRGRVVRIAERRNFGFILADNGQEFFFQRSDIANSGDWNKLQKDSQVFFWHARLIDGSNPHAVNVIIDDKQPDH